LVAFLNQSLNWLQAESLKVCISQGTSKEVKDTVMPLTEKITFKTTLQKGNRIQVPKLIRWQFKLEPTQTLKVGVIAQNTWTS
jgi:hypothetical protein